MRRHEIGNLQAPDSDSLDKSLGCDRGHRVARTFRVMICLASVVELGSRAVLNEGFQYACQHWGNDNYEI